MYKSLLLASLGLLAVATEYHHFDCGTDSSHASQDFLDAAAAHHENQTGGSSSPAARARFFAARRDIDNNSAITVNTVFHVVSTSAKKDSITSDMAQGQFNELNTAYKDYGIQFNLLNITWTVNDAWAVGAGNDDMNMKNSLRQGTYSTLNIYFQTDLTGDVLGKCTLPASLNGNKDASTYANDGCNVQAGTMPNGAVSGYNMGKTAVHETGHWMGLLHTFEGYSCTGPGDFIDDTPPEASSTDGCPTSPAKRTCGNLPNPQDDPIHNYMDYSTDTCYEGFTKLQHDRMHYMYQLYRSGN